MEFYKDFFYAILYFPIWHEETKTSKPVELDIIVFKNYIITIKYCDSLTPLNEFIETCEICNKEEREKIIGETTYETLYHIVQTLLEFSRRQLKHIEEKILTVEEDIFAMNSSKNNQKLIYSTLTIKRDLLGFRRIFLTLQNSLIGIDYKGEKFWGDNAKPYLLDLINDSNKVWNHIEHHYDLLQSLEDTLYTLINNNINALTKIYTIISFIAWPTLLIISWYQTNTTSLPFVGRAFDSYIVFSIALIPSVIIYLYLKRNKLI
jgi:magnesium transporter